MSRSTAKTNSDHTRELAKLKKLRGQIEGVEKMINEYRYCGEILAQVRSIRAGFLGIEASILETHLKNSSKRDIKIFLEKLLNSQK